MMFIYHSKLNYYYRLVLIFITFYVAKFKCFHTMTDSLQVSSVGEKHINQSHMDSRIAKRNSDFGSLESTLRSLSKLHNDFARSHKLLKNKRKLQVKLPRKILMVNFTSSLNYLDFNIDNDENATFLSKTAIKGDIGKYKIKTDENNRNKSYLNEINYDQFKTAQNMTNSTAVSRMKGKRGSKRRRFLSNVQSSLKEHVKSGKSAWAMTKKEAKQAFDKYYECINARVAALKKEDFPIKALLAVEGEKVEMPCLVCYRIDQDEDSHRAYWQVLRHETTALENVYPDNKRFSVSSEHTLLIEDIDVDDAGQYFCVEKHDYAEIYQLDVFLTDKRHTVKLGEDPVLPDTYLLKHNMHIFTMWAPWTECNTCDRPGSKSRVGQCSVRKIYDDIPIFPRDYPLMNLYPEGVPCHSTALPRHVRKLSEIGERDSETQVCPCEEVCPTDPPITQVTDETGKVVEVIQAGYYSMKDKPPVLPSLIKRKVLYEPENSHLLLHCPSDAKKHRLHWARQEREVDPNEIKKLTKGRVWVDSAARLHLKPLLLSDTDVYNCWDKNVKVASIKLIVVNEGNQNLKFYISYAGLGATVIGSLLCMFCICCKKSDKNAQ